MAATKLASTAMAADAIDAGRGRRPSEEVAAVSVSYMCCGRGSAAARSAWSLLARLFADDVKMTRRAPAVAGRRRCRAVGSGRTCPPGTAVATWIYQRGWRRSGILQCIGILTLKRTRAPSVTEYKVNSIDQLACSPLRGSRGQRAAGCGASGCGSTCGLCYNGGQGTLVQG